MPVFVLIADNDESTEEIGILYQEPTMANVPEEYRGYVISSYKYDVDDYDQIDTVEPEVYQLGETSRLNTESDELINNVQIELARRLGIKYFGKYQDVFVDEDGIMYGMPDEGRERKRIRIADHTHSPHNGRCDLNVVIAERDATAQRFNSAREDLRYDHNDSSDHIINEILNFFR